ncbi:LysR family transcriptional regulator [Streptomyces sp. DSM 44915]|uniref:LysR family transcriptional regulator n=1 Tax=Streptomyces chisholmiae TaxID=3075540 RepID=A0ABU2JYU3_9ACTN|nr:LysR family transcriptional regulator [Streptomyces sp. DSM 44915]MDT0269923.1 LysR family transcriptional regulator [Streptomyces sp. DSM 44915]
MTPDDPVGELRGYDLNLLVVFATLMRERNVTRTAEQLHMSQAAVSAALGRLRKLFDDPLFTRAPGGMAPTARAHRLHAPVRRGLDSLKIAIAGEPAFDPARSGTVFRLGMSDDVEALLLPALITQVTDASPDSSVFCLQANRMTVAGLLETGQVEVGVTAAAAWGPEIHSRTLFASRYACLHDPRALGRRGPLTRAEFVSLPHVMISADGTRGIVDDVLDSENLTRRRIASTAHFAMVPLLLASTPAIATMPRHAAEVFAARYGLEATEPPVALPQFTVSALWHRSNSDDPRVRWLVGQLAALAARLVPEPPG